MAILRTDIERALNELVADEEGMRFQSLAVVLAKQKWPDLIASERHKDGGLDARAPASLAADKKGKGLACSITATLGKIKGDAAGAKKNFPDVEILIFATAGKITEGTAQLWVAEIHKEFGYELIVMPREDIITSLMLPSNAALCGTLPGIHITVEKDDGDVLSKVREAVAEEAQNWRARQRMTNRPIISLQAVKLDNAGKATSETLDIDSLRAALSESRRVTLEASGGAGKTTTLLQLATENLREDWLAFLIDLPAWTRSGSGILEFIERAPAFRARNITAADLARLAKVRHFSFLLNGWNEIAALHSSDAVIALAELEREFPAAGIMVATRPHYISPPLPGAFRARLLPFDRRQRADYLRQTLGSQADDLRLQLEGNRLLDGLTRTPLILAEVAAIFQSGRPIPTTRIGVLGEVMKLIENSHEHRPHLEAARLYEDAQNYLEELAAQMTARGEVEIAEEAARSIIHSVTTALHAKKQIATPPDPAMVLHTLCAHHVLERIDYPSVAFRFQHQQFQEFYAARFLANALAQLAGNGDKTTGHAFAASYINKPMWEESLRMAAEEIRLRGETEATKKQALDEGVRLILLTLDVDPILTGDLSRLSGPAVWDAVRTKVGEVLRDWYAVAEVHHQRCALAAMLATGYEDFADIVIPLLTDKNRQVRMSAYEAGKEFYPTSLGTDWRRLVDTWDGDVRADFVSEVTHHGFMVEIGESFAINDPSEKVRAGAIQELSWIGATEALTRVLNLLDEAALEAALPALIPETIPAESRERVVAANRRLLAGETKPLDRIRRLLKGVELGDIDTAADLMTELGALSPPLDQYAAHAVGEALKVVMKRDEGWVSAWATSMLMNGTLWGEHWQPFVISLSQEQIDALIHRLATEKLSFGERSGIRIAVSASATPALAAQIFAKLCEVQQAISDGGADADAWTRVDQLSAPLRAIPVEAAVDGMLQSIPTEFAAVPFRAIVEILGCFDNNTPELRTELSDGIRQSLRTFLKEGISAILAGDLFDDETRAHTATALARAGENEDLADLRRLIDADIARGKARAATYSNWYVQALVTLGVDEVDAVLIDLLQEQKYEHWAALGLFQLVMPPHYEKPGLGNTIDYEAIWTARAGKRPPAFDEARAKRYAEVIKQRISELQDKRTKASKPEHFTGRLKGLAVVLAKLDGRGASDLVLETLALPGQWDEFVRITGVKALLLSGATLTLDSVLTVFDPSIEHLLSRELYSDQNLSLLFGCLELLLFSDNPAKAIARIQEVISRFQPQPYRIRELVVALGHSRSDAAVGFLFSLVRGTTGVQTVENTWIEALGRLNLPASREVLLSFIDPEIPWFDVNLTFDFRNIERLAAYIAERARQDLSLRHRLLGVSETTLTPMQQQLLPAIYRNLGGADALLAGANLLQSRMSPFGLDRGLETLFLERHPYDSAGAFELVPRNADQVRAKLFQIVLNDQSRRKAAFSILGQVEVWRIEHGRPQSEPRHPMIESGQPWPPLDLINAVCAGKAANFSAPRS